VIVTAAERERAFGEFVAGRYPSLVRTAYLLTGDRGHAEDLVQASLLRTFRAWGRLHAPENAEAYARTTMIRLAGKWRARRWTAEVPSAQVPDREVPDRAAEVNEAAAVHAALLTLSWSQRTVLVLRYFDDLPEAAVAALLECSVGTVKSRASRGLAALREAGLLNSRDVGEVHRD
jgi:RNA polymerase sigma-70 factor (sigma-E family)